jgi:hypothetical protein
VDLESRTIETASVNTIRAPAMEAVGKAASGMVTQAGPEPSRAEPILAGTLPHPDTREAAK